MSHKKINEKKISPFVVKLLTILDDPISQGIIQWVSPQAFSIIESDSFAKKILPKYYKHHNMSSFIRQLNIYGFTKLKNSDQDHIYCNPNFLKNSKKKLKYIQRRSNLRPEKLQSQNEVLKLKQSNSNMLKNLNALKNQNQQYRLKNQLIQDQINKLTQQRKIQVQNITNFFCDFVGNNFNIDEQFSTNTSEKQEQLYRNVVEALEQIRSFKDQNIMNNQQRIEKIIVYLKQKKIELQQKLENDKNVKQVQNKQLLDKELDEKLILFDSCQIENHKYSFQDPLFQMAENQHQYFLDNIF